MQSAQIPLPPPATAVLEALGSDFEPAVALVGGALRDALKPTGSTAPPDIDLAVEGRLEPVLERLGAPRRDHDRFATARLEFAGATVDLARTRTETYAHPGALPEVSPAALQDDLLRRDFTVNALALVLTGPHRSKLLGVEHALDDLEARRLRVLHAGSFRDDPTRLLRLARYAGRLGFTVEPATAELAAAAVAQGSLETVSGTRIGNELRLLVREPAVLEGFAALRELGLDAAIEPGFGLVGSDADAVRRALGLLPPDGRADVVVLAAALFGVAADRRLDLLDRLAFPAAARNAIAAAAQGAPAVADGLARARRPSQIAAAVGAAGPETVALAGGLGAAAPARRWLADLRQLRLQIDGDALLAAGVAPGPAVGAGLRAALAAALDGRAPGRVEQLEAALRGAEAADPGR